MTNQTGKSTRSQGWPSGEKGYGLFSKRKLTAEESKRYISLRRQFNKPVIGVTGYLGKTATLEMLRVILEARGRVLKNSHGHGNWQNNISTLEKLSSEYDYAMFEFDFQRGNHFAEILRLIKPTIGIVTNIGDAHLNYLSNIMQVVLEKSAVVKYLARGGLAVLNKDDELSSSLVKHIATKNIVTFGFSHSANFIAAEIEQLGPDGIRFKLNDRFKVQLPIYSIQDVYNFLAAAASAVHLGFELPEIISLIRNKYEAPQGRGRLFKFDKYYLLDESYSATPRSLSKAARSLIGFRSYSQKLILIIGDMTSAGINVEDQHLNMGYFLSALPIDYLITVGEYARLIAKGASLIPSPDKKIISVNTIDEILGILEENCGANATICVKGPGSVAVHRISKFLQARAGNGQFV